MIQYLSIDHVLQAIGIVVGLTSLIIGGTCAMALRWINSMCEDVKTLRTEFSAFVKEYYEKHEDTMKKADCAAKHAVLEKTVDALHERLDAVELDRR